ncbi:alkaline phosphatase family protein [Myxococcota bacterium]|nr:alkaline phosphatase family protein [Myxococcota bacterium]
MVFARRAETTDRRGRRFRSALLRVIVAALVVLSFEACRSPGRGADLVSKSPPMPHDGVSLVVLISIDQLRADRLDPRLPGGLGWIARSGRVFSNARLEHARTETCSGHATMLTGRQPAAAGLPGNTVVDRKRMEIRYCVEDQSARGAILGRRSRPEEGRSPRALRVSSLGDWLKAEHPEARVYSVSAKDRAAIALGGQRPDAAFWLDRDGAGRMTTSRYYLNELPGWVKTWTIEKILAPVPRAWRHASGDPPNGARADAFVGESTRWSMTSPHPIKPEGDTSGSIDAFLASPFLDERTLAFAQELVTQEDLGHRGEIDLLALSLSGTDFIGHSYGPHSQEARDALLRLDRSLASFLEFLRNRLGPEHFMVVLTSDHGVLPVPEWSQQQGGGCPVTGGRIHPVNVYEGLSTELDEVFGPGPEQADDVGASDWFLRNGYEIFFRPETLARNGASIDRVNAVAEQWLAQRPGVARVWRGTDLQREAGDSTMRTLYRNSSFEGGAGADLIIEPAYGCLFSPWPAGTSHGSPHDYDRDVPLVFLGPGIDPGTVGGSAAPVDIAPTLARELGISPPSELDGSPLWLRGEEASQRPTR